MVGCGSNQNTKNCSWTYCTCGGSQIDVKKERKRRKEREKREEIDGVGFLATSVSCLQCVIVIWLLVTKMSYAWRTVKIFF